MCYLESAAKTKTLILKRLLRTFSQRQIVTLDERRSSVSLTCILSLGISQNFNKFSISSQPFTNNVTPAILKTSSEYMTYLRISHDNR